MGSATKPRVRVRYRVAAVGMALASLVVMAGPSQSGTSTIKATGNDTWSPGKISVAKGSKVVWKNSSDERHNLTAYKGSWSKSSDLPEGSKTSFKFSKAGSYKFRCTLHSRMDGSKCDGMCGSVSVR